MEKLRVKNLSVLISENCAAPHAHEARQWTANKNLNKELNPVD